jgi:hypothetical protein
MFLFLRLLLAHCIGDFPLQVDEVVRRKHQGLRGHLLHGAIVGVSFLAVCAPFLSHPSLWALIAGLSVFHVLLDRMKIRVEARIGAGFWTFLADQALHVGSLCAVFFLSYSGQAPFGGTSPWRAAYNDSRLVLILISFICATFAGTYLLYFFKKSFLPGFSGIPVPKSLNFGLLERGLVLAAVSVLPGALFFLLPGLLFLHLRREKEQGFIGCRVDSVYAAAWGLVPKII